MTATPCTRVVFMLEEYRWSDGALLAFQTETYPSFAVARVNARGKSMPVIFEWIMTGYEDAGGFTVESDEFIPRWKSLAYNIAAKRERLALL